MTRTLCTIDQPLCFGTLALALQELAKRHRVVQVDVFPDGTLL